MRNDREGLFEEPHFIFERTFVASPLRPVPPAQDGITVREILRILSHLERNNPLETRT